MTDLIVNRRGSGRAGVWPELTRPAWPDTRDTVHLWTQIIGKVKLALNPMINHWWQVPLHTSVKGLTTGLMPTGDRGLEIEFDFVDHQLRLRTTDGDRRDVALEPRTVADFFAATMAALEDLGVSVRIHPRPVELRVAIPFARDETHGSYDAGAVHAFWRALAAIERTFSRFRCDFVGKQSAVNLWWGGFDLSTERFSGRTAPRHRGGIPNVPDYVQELAHSHELSAVGFWPGGSEEGAFYAFGYPEPPGVAGWDIAPVGARWDPAHGEFLLPYATVRSSPDPEATLLEFCHSAYDAVATLSKWDRALDSAAFDPRSGRPVEHR